MSGVIDNGKFIMPIIFLGYGVIGNTEASEAFILGSNPNTPVSPFPPKSTIKKNN